MNDSRGLQLQACRQCHPNALRDLKKGLPSPNSILLTGHAGTCDHDQVGVVSTTSVGVAGVGWVGGVVLVVVKISLQFPFWSK